jgi:hypothetical protein
MLHSLALEALAKEIARTRAYMIRERLAESLLWPAIAIALWTSVALSGFLQKLPAFLETVLSVAACLGLLAIVVKAALTWRKVTDAQARSRLAADNAFDPAQIDVLDDRPTHLDAHGIALWQAARAHAEHDALTARAEPRSPKLNQIDPYRLRYVALVALTASTLYAGDLAPDRVARAFMPSPGPLLGDTRLVFEAWATPADYVGAPPVSLTSEQGRTVETPPTVTVTMRLTGPVGAPVLRFDPDKGANLEVRMTHAADGAWEADLALPGPGVLRLVRFNTVAHWRIEPAPDAPPSASFATPPKPADGERLTIAWNAKDDYGVRALGVSLTPVDPPPGLATAPPRETLIDGPAGDPKSATGETEVDFAEHPYAGMEVEMRLFVRDALGQQAVSEPVRLELPEKIFLQPIALAALEMRRTILHERRPYAPAKPAPGGPIYLEPTGDWLLGYERIMIETDDQDPRLERAPPAILRAARMLDALTLAPRDGYFTDLAVLMGLQFARARLDRAREIEDTDAAAEVLWAVALRAEYGSSADAERALLQAQRALEDALANGASAERIERLMQALRRATENYMEALVAEAQREDRRADEEDTREETAMTGSDIEDMLQEVERLAQEGRMGEAQELLRQLSQMLQNMEVRLADGPGINPNGGASEAERDDAVEGLNQAMREQRALQDQTEREANSGRADGGEQSGGAGGQLAERQRNLEQRLEEAQGAAEGAGAGENEDLDQAQEAMQRASEALERGAFEQAAAEQAEAMQRLRAGAEQAINEMRSNDGDAPEQAPQNASSGRLDPLGRELPSGEEGNQDTLDMSPGEEQVRSRAIMDELRRRAQDQRRSREEREYLQRLLDRFSGS